MKFAHVGAGKNIKSAAVRRNMLKTYERLNEKALKIHVKSANDKRIFSEYSQRVERHKSTPKRDRQFIFGTRAFMWCVLAVVLAIWLLFAIFIIF